MLDWPTQRIAERNEGRRKKALACVEVRRDVVHPQKKEELLSRALMLASSAQDIVRRAAGSGFGEKNGSCTRAEVAL